MNRRAADTNTPSGSIPRRRFELSPYLYMQFMEPLGVDRRLRRGRLGSSARRLARRRRGGHARAGADDDALGRDLLGFLSLARRRRARGARPPMINLLWGGIESNQVGTAEFVDFCRRVHGEPLVCVNFESDGRRQYMKAKGSVRTGDAKEAAAWVAYCNDPANTRAKGSRVTRRRSESGTGRSATKRPTTRTASISRPRRARPSSSPKPCARRTRRSS